MVWIFLNQIPLKNKSLLAAWTKAIPRKDWKPGKYDYYAVNISNLNASMRSLKERVINFSLMQFQVFSQAFHPTCNHLENLQGNAQLNSPPRT